MNKNLRKIVSSSAPTSSFYMEAYLRPSTASSTGATTAKNASVNTLDTDRRKKDIHNMSKFLNLFYSIQ